MRKSSILTSLMGFALAMEGMSMDMGKQSSYNGVNHNEKIPPIFEIKPKGMKTYFFREDGSFWHSEGFRYMDETIFKCKASGNKSALKKFNKFKETLTK